MTVGDLDTLIPFRQNINVLLSLSGLTLEGDLSVPENSQGIVLFAHGSGSSRHSPRNRYVAEVLNKHNLATLLIDLLTPEEEKAEEKTRHLRFNISMLAERLSEIVVWVNSHSKIGNKPIGLFGSSTGAAAAILVACMRPDQIKAVVSRGGRVDLAEHCLSRIVAPTLLIVGANDQEVLKLNQLALIHLNRHSHMEIVPGASHLFEEIGALEKVAYMSAEWFEKHLIARSDSYTRRY